MTLTNTQEVPPLSEEDRLVLKPYLWLTAMTFGVVAVFYIAFCVYLFHAKTPSPKLIAFGIVVPIVVRRSLGYIVAKKTAEVTGRPVPQISLIRVVLEVSVLTFLFVTLWRI